MRYAPRKVFILKDGKYIETSYEKYQKIIEENPMRRFWLFEGMLMEVSEEDYQYFAHERERTRYLKKLSGQYELSYDALTTDIFNGEEILLNVDYCVEEIVEQKQLLNKITEAIKLLTADERRLIQVIYIEGKSEREYAAQEGVSQVTIHKRKQRLLKMLRDML